MAEEDPPVNPKWRRDCDDEPRWKNMTEDDLEVFYERVKDFVNENGEVNNVDWERLNFEILTADMVREKVGEGFPDEFYELMAKATLEENKVQDYRQLPLDKVQGEVVLKMS